MERVENPCLRPRSHHARLALSLPPFFYFLFLLRQLTRENLHNQPGSSVVRDHTYTFDSVMSCYNSGKSQNLLCLLPGWVVSPWASPVEETRVREWKPCPKPGCCHTDQSYVPCFLGGRDKTDTGIPRLLNVRIPVLLYSMRHLNQTLPQHDPMGTRGTGVWTVF